MSKILYTLCVVLITLFTAVFVTREQQSQTQAADPAQLSPLAAMVAQEQAQVQAIEQVSDAVVGIQNMARQQRQGEGSGVVFNVEGGNTYIITNEHVINGSEWLEIVFSNGSRQQAQIIGYDVFTDLALLRVEGYEAQTSASFGRTEELRIGQSVIAIGNPLGLDFAGSATMGIVSGHDRTVTVDIGRGPNRQMWEMTVMQTDTAINPGNSGGPLINLAGEVIGINTMKISGVNVYGMSFAIPTYIAMPVIEDLLAYGEVRRPTLGVRITALSAIPDFTRQQLDLPVDLLEGMFVSEVVPGSLAEEIGIQAGDIITHLGVIPVNSIQSFSRTLFDYRDGDQLQISLNRGSEMLVLSGAIDR